MIRVIGLQVLECRVLLGYCHRLILTFSGKADDYDVRDGAPDGRHVGRIYKLSVAPTGLWWFWAVQIVPALAAYTGRTETREAAMAALKAQCAIRA